MYQITTDILRSGTRAAPYMGSCDATVLVVDDEPPVTDLYADILTHTYTVETAYTGAEALNITHDAYDVVVLDRRMPDRSGDTVTTSLRDSGFDGPILMVSAVQPDTDLLELGIDEYLTKPVGYDDLMTGVERALTVVEMDPVVREYVGMLDVVLAIQSQYGGPADETEDAVEELVALRERVESVADEQVYEVVEAIAAKWPDARVELELLMGAASRDPA